MLIASELISSVLVQAHFAGMVSALERPFRRRSVGDRHLYVRVLAAVRYGVSLPLGCRSACPQVPASP